MIRLSSATRALRQPRESGRIDPMPRRFQFSLRALLVAITAICVWLGAELDGARRQRLAVTAIHDANGFVVYSFEVVLHASVTADGDSSVLYGYRPNLGFLRDLHQTWWRDLFFNVVEVHLSSEWVTADLVTALKKLRKLQSVHAHGTFDDAEVRQLLQEALPSCRFTQE